MRKLPRIHQYELLRELGSGGMGTVYLARDTRLARRVALKLLHAPSPEGLQRFLLEARATARCTHEHIVVIHDVDELDGQPYMVLEYLEGRPLSELLSDRPMPEWRAAELIVPVVRALVRAHGAGIVHRDLKPDNIFVTRSGVVKVLDFGIAKLLDTSDTPRELDAPTAGPGENVTRTDDSAIVGTVRYMAPEQWDSADVDHRVDIWAVGVMLFELLTGRHPLASLTGSALRDAVRTRTRPMPLLGERAPTTSKEMCAVVDSCLAKRTGDRYADAAALLDVLEPFLPHRRRIEENPFPGLMAFREEDADRFFGRDEEIARVVARIEEQPLVGVVGPSGAGKSSLVRAGVFPALKGSSSLWETIALRPGRNPLSALTRELTRLEPGIGDAEELAARLASEPGFAGTLLRRRAQRSGARVLLFVDQFEELFTLAAADRARDHFLSCLSGIADDHGSPVRAVVSIRSDFLDRLATHDQLMDVLTPGLVFLPPPSTAGLRAALVEPVQMAGFRYQDDDLVDEIIEDLAATPGALPLLQFAAGRLWDQRDRRAREITHAAYHAIGGIAGALATHADATVSELPAQSQRIARMIFERLVTPERTRDVVETGELCELASDRQAAERVIEGLVNARLLVVRSTDGDDAAVEIVHESMIESWPTLRRWLDDNHDQAEIVARIRAAAKQWHEAGQPAGLLWRGEAMEEVRHWRVRGGGPLAAREQRYVDALLALARRGARARRLAIAAALVFLSGLVVASAIALVRIRDAEQSAQQEAVRVRDSAERAQTEAERARRAELLAADKVRELEAKEQDLRRALDEATAANNTVAAQREALRRSADRLRASLDAEANEAERARAAADEALAARNRAIEEKSAKEALLEREQERARRIESTRGTVSRTLK